MTVRFTAPPAELREAVSTYVRDNVDQIVELLFSGNLGDKLAEAVQGAAPAEAKATQPEPQVHSVVSFTNRSPSDNVVRSYSAYRTRSGWTTSSGTSRLPKADASWEQIVAFADGKVEVLRDGAVKAAV